MNKHGILLEVVQVLMDLNLTIKRAYISSDGEWFMDGRISSSVISRFHNVSDFFFYRRRSFLRRRSVRGEALRQ